METKEKAIPKNISIKPSELETYDNRDFLYLAGCDSFSELVRYGLRLVEERVYQRQQHSKD